MNALHSFLHGAGRAAALLFVFGMASAWAAAPTAPPAARSELAPTGKLRVGLLVRNKPYVSRDGSASEMQGVAVDLSRELAKQLGVPFEPVRYEGVSKMLDGVKAGDWDVAFLGFEPVRTAHIDFTAPYAEIGSSYLVPARSPIRDMADIDKPGHRIGVTVRSAQDTYLTGNIKQAELIRVSVSMSVLGQMLNSGKLDVIVANRIALLELAEKDPGLRILEGSFLNVGQSLGIAKGRPAGTEYAKKFIEYAKSSGLVQKAIDRAGLRGLNVAPPASGM